MTIQEAIALAGAQTPQQQQTILAANSGAPPASMATTSGGPANTNPNVNLGSAITGQTGQVSVPNVALDPNTLAQQQAFVTAMQTQAAGGGPSVATQMLRNQQQQQAAATNAQVAGTRGVNPGMALRQGLQANAQANQTTAGQAAAARDQEQLNAQGILGNEENAIQQQSLNTQQANQGAALGTASINTTAQLGALQAQSQAAGGALSGLGAALGAGAAALAGGGVVPKYADGGGIAPISATSPDYAESEVSKYLKGVSPGSNSNPLTPGANAIGSAVGTYLGTENIPAPTSDSPVVGAPGVSQTPAGPTGFNPGGNTAGPLPMNTFASGGQVPALVSPGERYLPPDQVRQVVAGHKNPMAAGERIPGKPRVNRDSYANDTVPKTLKSGGIVLPLHVTQAPDAPQAAARFVAAVLAEQGGHGLRK